MVDYAMVVAGFVLLVKGADLLVNGASAIARRLNISDLTIGLTVVAFGTSAPELSVNTLAAVSGSTDIAVGNILGSNIANILLILGVAALISPLKVTSETVWREIPMNLLAAMVVAVVANDLLISGKATSSIDRSDGLLLLCFFTIFLYTTISSALRLDRADVKIDIRQMGLLKAAIFIVMGLAGLIFGGHWIVTGSTAIARVWGVSEALIGLTVVAVGTSLPELATSAVAAYRGNTDIAVGNVVGSNIFNIFFILGVSAVIHPLQMAQGVNRDIGAVFFAGLLLFVAMFTGKRRYLLDRWEGICLLLIYAGYVAVAFVYQN